MSPTQMNSCFKLDSIYTIMRMSTVCHHEPQVSVIYYCKYGPPNAEYCHQPSNEIVYRLSDPLSTAARISLCRDLNSRVPINLKYYKGL
jgi:hypothetical protein